MPAVELDFNDGRAAVLDQMGVVEPGCHTRGPVADQHMGFPNEVDLAKNCMRNTKSTFWGQSGGGQANFSIFQVVGDPPVPLCSVKLNLVFRFTQFLKVLM